MTVAAVLSGFGRPVARVLQERVTPIGGLIRTRIPRAVSSPSRLAERSGSAPCLCEALKRLTLQCAHVVSTAWRSSDPLSGSRLAECAARDRAGDRWQHARADGSLRLSATSRMDQAIASARRRLSQAIVRFTSRLPSSGSPVSVRDRSSGADQPTSICCRFGNYVSANSSLGQRPRRLAWRRRFGEAAIRPISIRLRFWRQGWTGPVARSSVSGDVPVEPARIDSAAGWRR